MLTPAALPLTQETYSFAKSNLGDLFDLDMNKFLSSAATQGYQSLPPTPTSGAPPMSLLSRPDSVPASSSLAKETPTPVEQASKADDKKPPTKSSSKKPAPPKVMPVPTEPVHPLFEAYKLGALLNPTKDLEDLLMTLSIDQLKFAEGVLSRIKKRKNYHLKKGAPTDQPIPFTPAQPVAEPEISIDLTLASCPKADASLPEASILGDMMTPSLSTSNTSPSCSQTPPAGLIDHSADNITAKENGEIWMKFKAKDSDYIHKLRVDIDPCHSEQTLMSAEFKEANSIFSEAKSQSEKDINSLGLRLAFLNPQILGNNKSLLQEAVDAFQVFFPGMFPSQQESLTPNGLLPSTSQGLGSTDLSGLSGAMVVNIFSKQSSTSLLLRADLDSVDLDTLSEDFKRENCVYPRALQGTKRGQPEGKLSDAKRERLKVEGLCNQWAWKLAYLNPGDLAGNLPRLQCALDTYRNSFTPFPARPCSSILTLPTSMPSDATLDLTSLMLDPQFLSLMS